MNSKQCQKRVSFYIDEAKSQSTTPSMIVPPILNPTAVDFTSKYKTEVRFFFKYNEEKIFDKHYKAQHLDCFNLYQ